MIEIKNITTTDELYNQQRELRNTILLRPLGLRDGSWETYDAISSHFVALENKKVVGCVVLVPVDEEPKKVRLIQMAVHTAMQGKGVGRLLIEEVLNFCKNQGITEINCHSRAYANNFYQKLGFEKYGESFEEVGIPHNHMKINL